jgi:hypothetical protein
MLNFYTPNFSLFPVLLFFVFCFQSNTAQNFDEIISSNRYINCDDVTLNASTMIRGFYDNKQIDKIYEFLTYWESKCGEIEEIYRLRTVLDINGNQFNSLSISEETIEDLLYYRNLRNAESNSINNFDGGESELDRSLKSLDQLIQTIARNSNPRTIDERLIVDFYAQEKPTFAAIKNAPNTSRVKEMHSEAYQRAYRMWQWHWAFAGGVYVPYGNISLFGTRPTVGLVMGGKHLRHNIDLIMDIRVGPSEEDYTFVYQGDVITDDTWTGIYFGAEYTFDFINTKTFDVGISPGIGYESITALSTDEDSDDDGKFLESFNYNVGLVVKYKYGKRGAYVGLQVRYNWADYENFGGTPLNGEYLNVRLTLGKIFNFDRHFRLQNLD